jgi:hypothetical protein
MKKALVITIAALVCVHSLNAAFAVDPEAAARQAEIDRDLAETKMRQLEDDEIAGGVVQNESTAEINARNAQIADLEAEAEGAERRQEIAESRQRQAGE